MPYYKEIGLVPGNRKCIVERDNTGKATKAYIQYPLYIVGITDMEQLSLIKLYIEELGLDIAKDVFEVAQNENIVEQEVGYTGPEILKNPVILYQDLTNEIIRQPIFKVGRKKDNISTNVSYVYISARDFIDAKEFVYTNEGQVGVKTFKERSQNLYLNKITMHQSIGDKEQRNTYSLSEIYDNYIAPTYAIIKSSLEKIFPQTENHIKKGTSRVKKVYAAYKEA